MKYTSVANKGYKCKDILSFSLPNLKLSETVFIIKT